MAGRRCSMLMAFMFGAGALLASCADNSDQAEIPDALTDVCSPETGCLFTDAVVAAACSELRFPERIMIAIDDLEVTGVRVFAEYPVVAEDESGYPTGEDMWPWNYSIPCDG